MTETKQRVFGALARLHARGVPLAGPTAIGRELGEQAGAKPMTPSHVSAHLKALVEEDRVEKVLQGNKRSLYRVADLDEGEE